MINELLDKFFNSNINSFFFLLYAFNSFAIYVMDNLICYYQLQFIDIIIISTVYLISIIW